MQEPAPSVNDAFPGPGSDGLPPSTEAIADWLGETNLDALYEIRAWRGDATVLAALERLRSVEPGARCRAFFAFIKADKGARKGAGFWPEGNCKDWYRAGAVARIPGRPTVAARAAPVPLGAEARASRAEAILGHSFGDRALLLQALRHSSASAEHNEQLAWLGDRIIGLWAARRTFSASPAADPGALTSVLVEVTNGAVQAELFFGLELHTLLEVGGSIRGPGGWITGTMAATAFEALAAALDLDGGTEVAEAFLERVVVAHPGGAADALEWK